MEYHRPVMLKECIEGLSIDPDGIYVDATFGGGGHSRAILEKISNGKLIAFDQDADAKREAEKIVEKRFIFCQANFMYLKRFLRMEGVQQVNGVFADLGVSSYQIDQPERGFSTRFDGPLDMRMNRNSKLTAAKILNESTEGDLHRIMGMYGEIKNARSVAKQIVLTRARRPFEKTSDLKNALASFAPRGKESKYFAQVFQALRIEVNEELKSLEALLQQSAEVIQQGGRLVVLSYHSLEDRLVKNYMLKGKVYGEADKDFYGNVLKPFEAVNRKPIVASEEEVEINSRARSAKLRVATRL